MLAVPPSLAEASDNYLASHERYEKHSKIGSCHGCMYKAKDTVTHQFVAMKKIRLDDEEQGVPSFVIREISILRVLSHPNIVELKDIVPMYEGKMYLIFDYTADTLHKMMHEKKEKLSFLQVKKFLYQILMGVSYCHRRRVMHRDLKPSICRITSDGTLKLSEFGLARTFEVPHRAYTHEVVTLWYRSPEILLGAKQYSTAVDIWSVGCIFAEMALGEALFPADSEIDQIFKIFQMLGTPNEKIWPGVSSLPDFKSTFPAWAPKLLSNVVTDLDPQGIDLLSQMLHYVPERRISAVTALRHPFFDDIRGQSSQKRRSE